MAACSFHQYGNCRCGRLKHAPELALSMRKESEQRRYVFLRMPARHTGDIVEITPMNLGLACASTWLPARIPHYAWLLLLVGVLRVAMPVHAPANDALVVQPPAAVAPVGSVLDFLD